MAARPKIESRPLKSFIEKVEQPKPCAKKKKDGKGQ